MKEIILHALPWGILGLLCIYAGSEPSGARRETLVRDIIKPMAPTPADEYAATLNSKDREYRSGYMNMWKGCKGYCVAGTGGREPRSGKCPFCGAT